MRRIKNLRDEKIIGVTSAVLAVFVQYQWMRTLAIETSICVDAFVAAATLSEFTLVNI